MHDGPLLALNAASIAALMLGLWTISLARRDVSIVDIFWGLGFVLVAWLAAMNTARPAARTWLLAGMVTLWGLRLGGYLAWRNLGKPEDYRYAAMRQWWGHWFPLVSLFVVFLLQGVLMWIVSLPIPFGVRSLQPIGWLDMGGAAMWLVGLLCETVGDWQLARFRRDPSNRGRVMDRGLWRYTRHPNYFGDFLVWWGVFLVSFGGTGMFWLVVSPVVMTVLLVRISGAALLEQSLKKRREGYEDYLRRTSPFFPWPPRR